jgi:hypothetical protein
MAVFVESGRRTNEAEPIGLLTEGAAGIAVIVLAVIALASKSAEALTAIAAIVIGIGLMVQAFNAAAKTARTLPAVATASQRTAAVGGEVMVDCLAGLTGIVLGILAFVGKHLFLLPPALIVYGGSLLLSAAIDMRSGSITEISTTQIATETAAREVTYEGPLAASGAAVLIGLAAIVLGILSLAIASASAILVVIGFLAVGAALLLLSASFAGAMMRMFTGS